jgi:hypothetical protein
MDGFDGWSVDGAPPMPITVLIASSGKTRAQLAKRFIRFDEMLPGCHDPKARLADMDRDGIDAQVLYGDGAMAARDPELRSVLARAYNDWLAEFCSMAPERLIGLAVVPAHDGGGRKKSSARPTWRSARNLLGMDGADFPITGPSYDPSGRPPPSRAVRRAHLGGGRQLRRDGPQGEAPPESSRR